MGKIMTIKQKNIVFGITSLFICFCFSLFLNNTDVAAYTCSYSGPNNSGKEDNYNLVSEGNAGSCYYMRADARDNSKKEEIFENGRATGRYQCTGGTVLHSDGDCWTYEKKYTNYKPTYDDGSEIPDSAFQAACQRQGTYYGAHYNYDRDNHSCEAGTGCSLPSNNETEGPGINFGGDCRKVGDGTQTAGEILGADPTKAKADECKNAGRRKLILWCLRKNYLAREFYEAMGGIAAKIRWVPIGEKKYEMISYLYEL